jgi:endonuclease/exonuclease/phosphatase family metal-dependent hydrolase
MDSAPVSRSRVRWLIVAALLFGMVLGAAVLRVAGGGGSDDAAQLAEGSSESTGTPTAPSTPTAPPTTAPPEPGVPTRFKVSSLNVLGAGHTRPNGRKSGWASGPERMGWLAKEITKRDVDVIGLQEFERPQYRVFKSRLGRTWDTFPGTSWGAKNMRNSVAWREDTWELVRSSKVMIPYFHGNLRPMPVVLLRNVESGRKAYFTSFHNPASTRGPAKKWRKQATRIEINLVNRLRAKTSLPVYVLGDMNEHEEYFCKMTAGTDMVSANGSRKGARGCHPRPRVRIDWIFGSPETAFTNYVDARNARIRRSTDHAMLVADAELPGVPYCPAPPTPSTTPNSRADSLVE